MCRPELWRYAAAMRSAGLVADMRCLGAYDHVCWAYDDPAQQDVAAAAFLAGGLAAGQRVWLMTGRGTGQAARTTNGFEGLDAAVATGAAVVRPMSSIYPPDGVVDPVALTATLAA